jgi:hypothetical protein
MEEPAAPKKAEWLIASGIPKLFAPPPPPNLAILQHATPGWMAERPNLTVRDVARFQAEDNVKLREGTADLNHPGRPPRPRSAVVLRAEICNLHRPPAPRNGEVPEGCYLVHCDSTDTTLARGKDFWVADRTVEARPLGCGRDFCSELGKPKFSKKYGGRVGLLFDVIHAEHQASPRAAPTLPKTSPRAPLTRSGQPAKPSPRARRADEFEEVPPLRRRRQCPTQARTRVSPRRQPPSAEPLLVFSAQAPHYGMEFAARINPIGCARRRSNHTRQTGEGRAPLSGGGVGHGGTHVGPLYAWVCVGVWAQLARPLGRAAAAAVDAIGRDRRRGARRGTLMSARQGGCAALRFSLMWHLCVRHIVTHAQNHFTHAHAA